MLGLAFGLEEQVLVIALFNPLTPTVAI